jgi:hypothetical protein
VTVVASPSFLSWYSGAGFASFLNGSEVHPLCGLFVKNMNIPDSVVDNTQGFIDNNLYFVYNDDDDILDDNVEEVLEVPVPEVLDKVMVQTADELHARMDLSLFKTLE